MNANLVMGSQRQHRDLFTGSVGLPNVGTHVGSVVHAFETMALKQVIEPKPPQSRLIPGPVKLSGDLSTVVATAGSSKSPENNFFKRRPDHQSPVRKITLATDPKLENPMASGVHRYPHDLSPNQSDYDTTLRGDYRKHFQDTLALDRNELNQATAAAGQNEDNDQLLRGTMVSRSFIKNIRKPRKVGDTNAPTETMTTKKIKTYVKSKMVPHREREPEQIEFNNVKPPATYSSATTTFRPSDRAIL